MYVPTAKQIKGDEMGAVINWDSFDETRVNQKGTVGMIMVKASSAEMGDSISNQIDQRFMNSSYATLNPIKYILPFFDPVERDIKAYEGSYCFTKSISPRRRECGCCSRR